MKTKKEINVDSFMTKEIEKERAYKQGIFYGILLGGLIVAFVAVGVTTHPFNQEKEPLMVDIYSPGECFVDTEVNKVYTVDTKGINSLEVRDTNGDLSIVAGEVEPRIKRVDCFDLFKQTTRVYTCNIGTKHLYTFDAKNEDEAYIRSEGFHDALNLPNSSGINCEGSKDIQK